MKAKQLVAKFKGPYYGGCANNDCPAIIEAEDGSFMIIGKKPTGEEDLKGLASIAPDEQLVIVPRELIINAKEALSGIFDK